SVPGMLHARLVLSSEMHALVEQIDTESSLAIPGVVAVLTAADLPISAEGEGRRFEPLARHEIVFAGQPVAIVVAETEAAAEDGAELVTVATTPLEPVSDLEAAMAPGSPLACRPRSGVEGAGLGAIHAGVGGSIGGIHDEELSGNVLGRALYGEGDVEAAFRESDAVIEGRFETSWVHQAYLEPQTATAWVEPD